eukprot:COSAG01_NODE_23227_length_823_cov_0.825967_2_plen_25_part_01
MIQIFCLRACFDEVGGGALWGCVRA